MAEITITKENFDAEVINSDRPVLIDFWAVWCGPCRMIAPTVSEFAEENPSIKVGKVNVDDEPELADRFGIMSIPTLIAFKDGKAVAKSVGLANKEKLKQMF